MSRSKRYYRKGIELFHNDTKEKIMFGNWNADGDGVCLTKDKRFITILKNDLDTCYTSYAEVEKQAKERRRGQAW